MKKVFLVILIGIMSISLLGCSTRVKYENLKMTNLSIVNTISSTQMSVRKNIDLENKVYTRSVYNDLDIEIESLTLELDDSFIDIFRQEIVESKLFDVDDNDLVKAENFGMINLVAKFEDTPLIFTITSTNNIPKNSNAIDKAIYNLTGDTFFNSLPSSIFNPPLLGLEFVSKLDNYEYKLSSFVDAINYSWNKETVKDNDILEMQKDHKIKAFNHYPTLNLTFTNVLGHVNKCIHFNISQYDNIKEEFVTVFEGESIYGSSLLCHEDSLYKINVDFDAGSVEYAFYIKNIK